MENLLGPRIKRLRKIKGFTQEQLAEKCNVSPSCVSRWETGSLFPRRNNIEMLATALQVDAKELISDKGVIYSDVSIVGEFVPLIERLAPDEQEYFLSTIQAFLEMKHRKSKLP